MCNSQPFRPRLHQMKIAKFFYKLREVIKLLRPSHSCLLMQVQQMIESHTIKLLQQRNSKSACLSRMASQSLSLPRFHSIRPERTVLRHISSAQKKSTSLCTLVAPLQKLTKSSPRLRTRRSATPTSTSSTTRSFCLLWKIRARMTSGLALSGEPTLHNKMNGSLQSKSMMTTKLTTGRPSPPQMQVPSVSSLLLIHRKEPLRKRPKAWKERK